jgi:hypothetical protein
VRALIQGEQDVVSVESQPADGKGFLKEIRELPGSRPRTQGATKPEGVVQIALDCRIRHWAAGRCF